MSGYLAISNSPQRSVVPVVSVPAANRLATQNSRFSSWNTESFWPDFWRIQSETYTEMSVLSWFLEDSVRNVHRDECADELDASHWWLGNTLRQTSPGGAVAQAAAPTMNGLECPQGPGFKSPPWSFPDLTSRLFYPAHFLSYLHYPVWIKAKSPKINIFLKDKHSHIFTFTAMSCHEFWPYLCRQGAKCVWACEVCVSFHPLDRQIVMQVIEGWMYVARLLSLSLFLWRLPQITALASSYSYQKGVVWGVRWCHKAFCSSHERHRALSTKVT